MTEEEIEATVSKAVAATIDRKLGQFYIDRETHWEDHKFISELRKMFDVGKAEMCKTVVKWTVSVLLGLIMLGWVVTKGFFPR
jgi:hypothetical protein